MYGYCFIRKFTSNSRGGIIMFMDNGLLLLLMTMLLGIDILPTIDDED